MKIEMNRIDKRNLAAALLGLLMIVSAHAADPAPPGHMPPMGLFVSGGSPALISPPGTFAKGDEVTIISLPDFAVHCCAHVGGAATLGGNAQSSEVEHTAGVALRAQGLLGTTADAAPAVVIKGRLTAKKSKAGLMVDLDGDGRPELLKACPSSEGIHLTAWQGRKRVWHGYLYLGIDMESACSAAETR
jgi:hypothetical protein